MIRQRPKFRPFIDTLEDKCLMSAGLNGRVADSLQALARPDRQATLGQIHASGRNRGGFGGQVSCIFFGCGKTIDPLPAPAAPRVSQGPDNLSGQVYIINGERVRFLAERRNGIDFYNTSKLGDTVKSILAGASGTHKLSDNSSNPLRYRFTLPSNTKQGSSAVLFLIEQNLDENKSRWLALRNSNSTWYVRSGANPSQRVTLAEGGAAFTRKFEDNGDNVTMTVLNPKDNTKAGISRNDIWYSFQSSH